MRVLKGKYEKCVEAKEMLLEKHFQYGERAKIDLAATEMVEWMNPKIDAAEDLLDEVFILLDDDERRNNTAQNNLEKEAEAEAEQELKKTELEVITKQSKTDETLLRKHVADIKNTIEDEMVTPRLNRAGVVRLLDLD